MATQMQLKQRLGQWCGLKFRRVSADGFTRIHCTKLLEHQFIIFDIEKTTPQSKLTTGSNKRIILPSF